MKILNTSLFILSVFAITSCAAQTNDEIATPVNSSEHMLQTRVDTSQRPPPRNEDTEQSDNRRPNNEGQRPAGRPPSAEEAFKMFDANSDGKLSPNEVKGPLAASFDKIDTDGNGSISLPELSAAPRPGRPSGPPPKH